MADVNSNHQSQLNYIKDAHSAEIQRLKTDWTKTNGHGQHGQSEDIEQIKVGIKKAGDRVKYEYPFKKAGDRVKYEYPMVYDLTLLSRPAPLLGRLK